MKFKIEFSNAYKKSYKRAEKRGLDMNKLDDVVKIIANGENLPEIYKDYSLNGKYKNCRECHILPDWLLIYRKLEDVLVLYLIETGTHSDLFE